MPSWRKEIDNRPGELASALEPLAQAGADLQVVMAYRYPGADKGAVELHPVSGRKPIAAAQTAGIARSSIPVLLVEGDNRPGLGYALAKALGDAGINMNFVMAQVVGRVCIRLRQRGRRGQARDADQESCNTDPQKVGCIWSSPRDRSAP
jgi:hypothetical protein